MKWLSRFALCVTAFACLHCSAYAVAFTSMYVFGDGLSATTTAPSLPFLHGNRYSNGRVWVELIAQRQGVPFGGSNTVSYFGHYSSNLVINVTNFNPPQDVSTALFVVWVNNADFVDIIELRHDDFAYPTNIVTWSGGINQALSNHVTAIQTLYNKGARTLVAPNGVDVTKIPGYVGMPASSKAFVRERIIEFNNGFLGICQQVRNSFSNLTLISPDYFTLTDRIIAQPGAYGMTNSTQSAVYDYSYLSFTNQGTNFVFWDQYHPTAKVHEILADTAQQLISPVRISQITASGSSNQLSVVNVPIGLNGFVESSTNLAAWSQTQNFTSSNATQTVVVPASGARQFYRLRFPFSWTWP